MVEKKPKVIESFADIFAPGETLDVEQGAKMIKDMIDFDPSQLRLNRDQANLVRQLLIEITVASMSGTEDATIHTSRQHRKVVIALTTVNSMYTVQALERLVIVPVL